MGGDRSHDSTACATGNRDTGAVRHRFQPWNHLHRRGNALPASDRDGGHLQRRADGGGLPYLGLRDTGKQYPVDLQSHDGPRTGCPLATAVESYGRTASTRDGGCLRERVSGSDGTGWAAIRLPRAKHYMGYGVPVSGKDRTPATISESELREKHFEPFRASIVEGGALSLMANSGIVNGVSTHADYRLLTEWVKKDLNFDGVIVSDWADVQNLLSRDRIAASYKEAVKMAINAGIDLVMEPYNTAFCPTLVELVNEGAVSMNRINDAVRRILRLKFRLGLFDNPYWSTAEYPDFGCAESEAIAKAAADESITLLKNADGILPLPANTRILVAGPNAHSMRTLNGGWSYSWQGEKVEEFAQDYNTIYEALKKVRDG